MNVIYIVDTMNRLNKQRKKDSKKFQDKIKKLNKTEKDSWVTKIKKYFKK
jgi:hypothetical protein